MNHRFLLALTAAAFITPAAAHHSGSMFDTEKTVTLKGEVRRFEWTNPHCWIQLVIAGPNGPIEWSVELGSPMQLYRNGWRPKTLQPGQVIVVQGHPTRNGSHGAAFISATRADGAPVTTVK